MASRQEFIALVFPLWFPLFVVVRCKVLQLITVSFDCVHRYEYFGLQYYGECWSGPNTGETYAKNGRSKQCVHGVGKNKANAVYRVTNLPPLW